MTEGQKCRGCGAPIEFIRGPNRKDIPAQRVKTIYVKRNDLVGDEELVKLDVKMALNATDVYVNHFETCPNADDFRKGKR